jgi:hypothetical protein
MVALSAVGPSAAADSSGPVTLAGYQAQALAVAARFQLNSPGLLPLGDPAVGTILESDLPFARTTVDPGPVIDALASPLYPGDTIAHLGSALSTFGAPGIPNEPVLADSQYPPSPGFPGTASFGNPTTTARVATAASNADQNGATAAGAVASFGLPGVLSVAGTEATNHTKLDQSSIESNAEASLGTVDIGGVIRIAGLRARASATSDGTTGKPAATLEIGKVTVAGLAAFIDQNGIHLAGTAGASGLFNIVSDLLNKTLSGLGVTVKAVSATLSHNGPSATADSGGLEITVTQHTPGILNFPGSPVIPLPPPLPTIGPGVPPLTEQLVVVLGQAHAAVNASLAPAFGEVGAGPPVDQPLPPPPASPVSSTTGSLLPSGAGASAPAALAATPPALSGAGAGPLTDGRAARATPVRGRLILGLAPGAAQILAAVVAVILGAGVLLGYARWQLLTGRPRVP